jgi:hypothetical protein
VIEGVVTRRSSSVGTLVAKMDSTAGLGGFDRRVFIARGRHDFRVPPASRWDPLRRIPGAPGVPTKGLLARAR